MASPDQTQNTQPIFRKNFVFVCIGPKFLHCSISPAEVRKEGTPFISRQGTQSTYNGELLESCETLVNYNRLGNACILPRIMCILCLSGREVKSRGTIETSGVVCTPTPQQRPSSSRILIKPFSLLSALINAHGVKCTVARDGIPSHLIRFPLGYHPCFHCYIFNQIIFLDFSKRIKDNRLKGQASYDLDGSESKCGEPLRTPDPP